MKPELDRLEQRLVGVLVEKERTVPDAYPLTVHSLVLGANQKNNRDPHTNLQESEVEAGLRSLMAGGWVLEHDREGGRVRRYSHQAGQRLGVDGASLALLAELLLRGPQAAGELRTRAERMHAQGTLEEVEQRLAQLAARPVALVRRLERQPGERAPRWAHVLGLAGEGAPAAQAGTGTPAPRPATPAAGEVGAGADEASELARLARRVAALEERLARLEGRAPGA